VCRVTVGTALGALRAGLRVDGHRVYFKVEKTLEPKPNTCEVRIWNLSATQRAQIEELEPKEGSTRGIPVLIEAGYEETDASQIFLGDLRTAYSTRDGADWVTTIESGDGEHAQKNSRIVVTLGPKTNPETALRAIVRALGIGEGNLPSVVGKLRAAGVAKLFDKRAVLYGSAADRLTNFCHSADLEWSIQDGALQILDKGKTLAAVAVRLTSETGLVESPTVDPKGVLSFKMLIQPAVRPGALLVVASSAASGNYRLTKGTWEGDTHDIPWYISGEAKRY
jgi:hypothetical protein